MSSSFFDMFTQEEKRKIRTSDLYFMRHDPSRYELVDVLS